MSRLSEKFAVEPTGEKPSASRRSSASSAASEYRFARSFARQRADDRPEPLRQVARDGGRVGRLLVEDLVDERRERVGGERLAQRERLVEDDAEREDVRARVELVALDLLGRHVGRRPDHLARRRELRVSREELADPEVRDLGRQRRRQEDVRGLDVAVEHAALVRVRERLGDLGDDADAVPDRETRRDRRGAARSCRPARAPSRGRDTPASSPTSKTVTMCGCWRRPEIFASLRKRAFASSALKLFSPSSKRIVFSASSRSICGSRAR